MKKSDLKQLIKPLVKECINEVLIEEGLLSNVVSEVAKGLQANVITEQHTMPTQPKQQSNNMNTKNIEAKKKLEEHRKKMMDSIGEGAYNGVNLFEGTTPTTSQQNAAVGTVDLGNPTDSGVDISSLVGDASQIWKAMK
tara:strand:+ start:11493 stop:11909 length:417 start_codon:yes stop_codon:yes gene_type:complete